MQIQIFCRHKTEIIAVAKVILDVIQCLPIGCRSMKHKRITFGHMPLIAFHVKEIEIDIDGELVIVGPTQVIVEKCNALRHERLQLRDLRPIVIRFRPTALVQCDIVGKHIGHRINAI